MPAWRGWYHVTSSTYGTWLPGDQRGWRERRHRVHVPGDYKNPPPPCFGMGLLAHSRRLLKGPAVYLRDAEREAAGQALVDSLTRQRLAVIAVSLDATHFHLLAQFPDA